MFLALLAIIYIANGHWADNTMRDINTTTRQVKNMEYEYKNLKSLEMYRSRESQVTQAASALGLKPAAEPPVKLEVEKSKTENWKTTNTKIKKGKHVANLKTLLSKWKLRKTYYGAFISAF